MSTLSAESQIAQKLQALDMSAASLASIAGSAGIRTSQARISEAINQVRPLDNGTAASLLKVLAELEELTKAVSPIPISFRNPKRIAELLKSMHEAPLDCPSLSDLVIAAKIAEGSSIENIAAQRNVSVQDLNERVCEIVVKMFRLNESLLHAIK
jgi:hypothetical protein